MEFLNYGALATLSAWSIAAISVTFLLLFAFVGAPLWLFATATFAVMWTVGAPWWAWLVIAPPGEVQTSAADADALLIEALKSHKASQAAAEVARATGLDRKMLYARAMELK